MEQQVSFRDVYAGKRNQIIGGVLETHPGTRVFERKISVT
jgi:hypothetical protein